ASAAQKAAGLIRRALLPCPNMLIVQTLGMRPHRPLLATARTNRRPPRILFGQVGSCLDIHVKQLQSRGPAMGAPMEAPTGPLWRRGDREEREPRDTTKQRWG